MRTLTGLKVSSRRHKEPRIRNIIGETIKAKGERFRTIFSTHSVPNLSAFSRVQSLPSIVILANDAWRARPTLKIHFAELRGTRSRFTILGDSFETLLDRWKISSDLLRESQSREIVRGARDSLQFSA